MARKAASRKRGRYPDEQVPWAKLVSLSAEVGGRWRAWAPRWAPRGSGSRAGSARGAAGRSGRRDFLQCCRGAGAWHDYAHHALIVAAVFRCPSPP